MRVAVLTTLVLLVPLLAGCFTAPPRTDWAFEMTQLEKVHAAGLTGKHVTVAILDTGIDARHSGLRHLVDGSEANGELVGFKDYIGGRSGVASAYDDDGHGTHVAGIIAAEGSSLGDKVSYQGVELLGGAPHVRLLVARVCQKTPDGGDCDVDALPHAVDWAVQNGARVVSLSLGGAPPAALLRALDPDALESSIRRALDAGIVVIAAAGNGGPVAEPAERTPDVIFPADIPGVIAVGSVDKAGRVSGFSSRGDDAGNPCQRPPLGLPGPTTGRCDPDRKPEIVAPGEGILSSWLDGGYAEASGTSQATPFVTATVATMLEGHAPLRTASDVKALKQAIVSTARLVVGQAEPHDEAAGYGILQANQARLAFK